MTTADYTPEEAAAAEAAQATAYMTAAANGFGLVLADWKGWPNGVAVTFDDEGTRLIYTGDELHPFDALIPCKRHGRHRIGVTYAHDLDQARVDVAECERAFEPPIPLRPATPSDPRPLWDRGHSLSA